MYLLKLLREGQEERIVYIDEPQNERMMMRKTSLILLGAAAGIPACG
jgi:hypothetical protein